MGLESLEMLLGTSCFQVGEDQLTKFHFKSERGADIAQWFAALETDRQP